MRRWRPAQQRLPPVWCEVEIRLRAQEGQQRGQMTVDIRLLDRLGLPHIGVANHIEQRLRDLLGRQYQVDDAGADRAPGHTGISSGCRVLRDGDAAFGLDEAQARRTVRAGARKNDADRPLPLWFSASERKKMSTGRRWARGSLGLLGWSTSSLSFRD
jgi:hypothetical protein